MHKAIAASALTLGIATLGGCQSMAMAALKSVDSKPYSVPVQAAQLKLEPEPVTAPAIVTEAAPVEPVAIAAAEPAPPPPPARTDVRGAGDGSMKVDRIIITAKGEEVRHRAPYFSREQVASMICGWRPRADKVALSLETYKATVAALETRAAYEAGDATLKQLNATEKKRGDTLAKFMGPGLTMGWGRDNKGELPKPEQDGLVLENVDLFTFRENGVDVMAVSGVARNTSAAAVETPPLTLQALDRWEFILAGQTSLLPFDRLEAGEARPFEMRFLNPPETTDEVYAHFAPPFEYRANRLCENFDPLTADYAKLVETPRIEPSTAPVHTAAELNLLTRLYRNEIEGAWNCRKGKDSEPPKGGLNFESHSSGERREGFSISLGVGKPNMERMCAPAAQRLRWREMFQLAEATDEAWGAMLAANETRRLLGVGEATQMEADIADRRQAETYAYFRELGFDALKRIGGSTQDIVVELEPSTFGYAGFDKGGFYLEVSGVMRNTGSETRDVDALMLALVDRLEQPILSITLDDKATLAAGESKAIKHRIHLPDPTRSGHGKRPPWQVRIGAMSRQTP